MTPELKAFRHLKKNLDHYLPIMESFWPENLSLEEACSASVPKLHKLYDEIASKFGASGEALMKIYQISYDRSVERAFR